MDKHTLKANALAAMRATIAHEWSAFMLNVQLQKNEGPVRTMYKEAIEMTTLETEQQMKQCYKSLKEYYENG